MTSTPKPIDVSPGPPGAIPLEAIRSGRMEHVPPDPIALTVDELALVQKLGECATEFGALLTADRGARPERDDPDFGLIEGRRATLAGIHDHDVAEFFGHIHDLQHAVMARAARRAHPEAFPARQPVQR